MADGWQLVKPSLSHITRTTAAAAAVVASMVAAAEWNLTLTVIHIVVPLRYITDPPTPP